MKIAHIINPFKAVGDSILSKQQPITFKTMKIAKDFAQDCVDVDLFSAQFSEDRDFVPDYFQKTEDLDRSTLDLKFKYKRKLPFLKDILDRLYSCSDAEYFIYTNVDEGVLPHFYILAKELIENGNKAFTITRRVLNETFLESDLGTIYSQVGKAHAGYGCFIYRRKVYPKYKIGNMFLGFAPIGKILLKNFEFVDGECGIFTDLHATFHIGPKSHWRSTLRKDLELFSPIRKHNGKIYNNMVKILQMRKK